MDVTNQQNPNETTMQLAGESEVRISRTFNAPARLVFKAWTDPALVAKWWAPLSLGVQIVSCDADVREGGQYRYVIRAREHGEMAFYGTYKTVTPHSKLVYTQVFEPMASSGEVVVTVTFTERNGRTELVSSEVYPSAQTREMSLQSGMEVGMRDTMELLAKLVELLARTADA